MTSRERISNSLEERIGKVLSAQDQKIGRSDFNNNVATLEPLYRDYETTIIDEMQSPKNSRPLACIRGRAAYNVIPSETSITFAL